MQISNKFYYNKHLKRGMSPLRINTTDDTVSDNFKLLQIVYLL